MNQSARLGPTNEPPRLQLGDMRLTILDGGHLWLDGGAMFGIIPKPLWSRLTEADEQNRIPLAMSCFLVETEGKMILVETGSGLKSKYHEKEQGIFRLADHSIVDSLAAIGIEPDQIDLVILTHLHFDHAGGGTTADTKGTFVPTFPRAKYIVQQGEWDDAVSGHAVMTATYRTENLAPLEAAGVLSLVKGTAEIAAGVSVRPTPGHTRHQQGVVFSGGERTVVLPADLMPTSAHLGLPYNMAYDLLPFENMVNKEGLLDECLAKGWQLALGQDPQSVLFDLSRDERGRFQLEATQP